MSRFNEGMRVYILPWGDEPEQFGTCCGPENNGVVVVQVDLKYYDPGDDGLREIPVEQLEALPEE